MFDRIAHSCHAAGVSIFDPEAARRDADISRIVKAIERVSHSNVLRERALIGNMLGAACILNNKTNLISRTRE